MIRVKVRNGLILAHLFIASALAPAFLLVAVTGAMDLAGIEADLTETDLSIPKGLVVDPDDPAIEDNVTAMLVANDLAIDFESLRVTPTLITTRPTSRSFVRIRQVEGEWRATLNEPDLQYSLMELHKGHGPAAFKAYQIGAGVALFLVILGGLLVGLMAKPYRRKTGAAFALGTLAFLALAFVW